MKILENATVWVALNLPLSTLTATSAEFVIALPTSRTAGTAFALALALALATVLMFSVTAELQPSARSEIQKSIEFNLTK
jgi:hypothetical protein